MTFSSYLTHLRVLENVGMTRIDPVAYKDAEVVPLQFPRGAVPARPASLGPRAGPHLHRLPVQGGQERSGAQLYVYNICGHEAAYRGRLPGDQLHHRRAAMIGAKMMLTNTWKRAGVWNMEEFDPGHFMADLNHYGLPWQSSGTVTGGRTTASLPARPGWRRRPCHRRGAAR